MVVRRGEAVAYVYFLNPEALPQALENFFAEGFRLYLRSPEWQARARARRAARTAEGR
jgi:hypothetical protein